MGLIIQNPLSEHQGYCSKSDQNENHICCRTFRSCGCICQQRPTYQLLPLPIGFLPGEKCLTEDDHFGHAQTCRFGFDNACESLIIDDRNASIYYNRKCARKGVTVRWGCHDEDIEIQGEGTFKGRICYCDPAKDGDLCNTETQIPINGTELF